MEITHLYNIVPNYAHEWRFWDSELERFIKGLKRTDSYKDESPRKV
jgi:S-formylglutathione hydrolase FrmB